MKKFHKDLKRSQVKLVNNMESTQKAIEKIHEFQRFGSILGLERMTRLLEALDNPQDDLKVIHVAGTNGKGSVCRYIYSILQEAGYKTGIYTSPFLEVFNERIELDGEFISDEDLAVCTDKVLAAVSEITKNGEQSPTEFEVITAVAFVYFKEKQCDYAVLEVGLGGKGDSTNVCKMPLMTVISSISMDHMDRLGNTIEAIASEKAGIIKDGCPVVTSAKDIRALRIIRENAEEHGSMLFETERLPISVAKESLYGSKFDVNIQGVQFDDVEISMAGRHQIENAVAAMCAINIMEERGDVSVSKGALYDGLKKAKQPGRFELMSAFGESPEIIIDGAHNHDGAKALAETVKSNFKDKRILMVTGMLADKDVGSIISEFAKITKDFIVTEPISPRRLKAEILADKLESMGGECITMPLVEDAYKMAVQRSDGYDVIIYAGSLYLIGKIRSLLCK